MVVRLLDFAGWFCKFNNVLMFTMKLARRVVDPNLSAVEGLGRNQRQIIESVSYIQESSWFQRFLNWFLISQ